jgi:hypothetical protein
MLTTSPLAPAVPQSVFRAVQLMYTGAALSALTAVAIILTAPRVGIMPGIGSAPARVQSHTEQVVRAAFLGAVYCAVWLWMARKNKEGRGWARILSTVLFGLCCFGTTLDLRGGAIEVRALDVVVWLVALATISQLWRPGSGPFYQKPLMLV